MQCTLKHTKSHTHTYIRQTHDRNLEIAHHRWMEMRVRAAKTRMPVPRGGGPDTVSPPIPVPVREGENAGKALVPSVPALVAQFRPT